MDMDNLSPHPVIIGRKSRRIFDPDRPVSKEMVETMLEAARWAPSSGNQQPWHYMVFSTDNKPQLELAQSCLNPDNQVWANKAPVLIASIAQMINDRGRPNKKALHDLGLANENLLIQAVSMGLSCRPMGGFDVEKLTNFFEIPVDFQPVVMIAVGYLGQIDDATEEVRDKEGEPRTRKTAVAFTHWGKW